MKSLKVLYRDGTAITIEPHEIGGRHKIERADRAADGETAAGCKGKKASSSSDDGLFPAFRAPLALRQGATEGIDSVDTMIDHLNSLKNTSALESHYIFAVKDHGIDPHTAREIFERIPDGAHVTLLGDHDA